MLKKFARTTQQSLWLIFVSIACASLICTVQLFNSSLFHPSYIVTTNIWLVKKSEPSVPLITDRNYRSASDGSVFIFSAYERCQNRYLLLNVWENHHIAHVNHTSYACCFLLSNSSTLARWVTWGENLRYPSMRNATLLAAKLQCRVPEGIGDNYAATIVQAATVTRNGIKTTSTQMPSCPTRRESYVKPSTLIVPPTYKDLKQANLRKLDQNCIHASKRYFSLDSTEPFSFAVCAKLAFGKLDSHILIEWMEYNLKMGVSKVLVYTHDLNAEAMRVLQYYMQTGKLLVLPFDLPLPESPKRKVGDKNTQAWNDEQVVLYDCYERLRLFKFVAVVDFDEFIVPNMDNNFKDLMKRLRHHQPLASTFEFRIMFHIKDWAGNLTIRNNDIVALKYRQHSRPIRSNIKFITMPGRIPLGTVWTHEVPNMLEPFDMLRVPQELAGISHYRTCRRQWQTSCFKKPRMITSKIFHLFDNSLQQTILKKKILLLK